MAILIFPGQGAKSSDLISKDNHISSEILEKGEEILGYNILELNPEQLKDTKYSQPDLFLRSMVLHNLFKTAGGTVTATAGHSLGQYSACVACGALDLETGLSLIKARAGFMSEDTAQNKGSMVACIGPEVESILNQIVQDFPKVHLANYNSSHQIVVAGDPEQITEFSKSCKEKGVKCIPLNVAGAFHTNFMSESNTKMNQLLEKTEFKEPTCGLISNKTSKILHSAAEIQEEFIDQIILPVRWTNISHTIAELASQEECEVYEIGAGNILGKLVQTETGVKVHSVEDYLLKSA